MDLMRAHPYMDMPAEWPPGLQDLNGADGQRRIGQILSERQPLSEAQIEAILDLAASHDLRFGDAAVALGHVSAEQVLAALAEQFQYPCAPHERHHASAELVVLSQPFSPEAEAIRAVRSQVMRHVFRDPRGARALALVSPHAGDGKTYLAANLAVGLAQMGGRTLIVDADLRSPRLHEVFEVDHEVGLSSVLLGHMDLQVIQPVHRIPGLHVLPVGIAPPNPLELIERAAFGQLMVKLTSHFDHVLVDTPAAEYGADAQAIADRCGATLMVARRNASRVGELQALIGALTESPTRLIGVILNEF